MEEFVAYVIRNLVDTPEDVKIEIFEGSKSSSSETKATSKALWASLLSSFSFWNSFVKDSEKI